VLVLGVSVLSGHLPVAAYCPRSVQPFDVSQTTKFMDTCFKESRVGGCELYTCELPLLRD
jgi:hypothetical protein